MEEVLIGVDPHKAVHAVAAVDGRAVDLQVARDALVRPTLFVECHHGLLALRDVLRLVSRMARRIRYPGRCPRGVSDPGLPRRGGRGVSIRKTPGLGRPMRRRWTREELEEAWTLGPDEHALLSGERGPTRLGFAVLVKLFAKEDRFPVPRRSPKRPSPPFVARQVGVPAGQYAAYDRTGRTAAYVREPRARRVPIGGGRPSRGPRREDPPDRRGGPAAGRKDPAVSDLEDYDADDMEPIIGSKANERNIPRTIVP